MIVSESVFDLDRLTRRQRELVESAIRSIRFDPERLLPGMREHGVRRLVVTFDDLSGETRGANARHELRRDRARAASTLGLFYDDGRIQLDYSLNELGVKWVFTAEFAHAVDLFLLDDQDRIEIAQAYEQSVPDSAKPEDWWANDYFEQIGEAFMFAFMRVATSLAPPVEWEASWRITTPRVMAAVKRALAQDKFLRRSLG